MMFALLPLLMLGSVQETAIEAIPIDKIHFPEMTFVCLTEAKDAPVYVVEIDLADGRNTFSIRSFKGGHFERLYSGSAESAEADTRTENTILTLRAANSTGTELAIDMKRGLGGYSRLNFNRGEVVAKCDRAPSLPKSS